MFSFKDALKYSYEPHLLGLCGPIEDCSKILLDYINGKSKDRNKVKDLLKQFDAVYIHCQKIAEKNKIADPLSAKVLEAYWMGNDLLKKFKTKRVPHHSYHVFHVGSITGRIEIKGKLLDICRVSWGEVVKFNKNFVWVRYQPLVLKPKRHLGKLKTIKIKKGFLDKVKLGDMISWHWNRGCQVLNQKQVENLKYYTLKNL